jgi:Ycf4
LFILKIEKKMNLVTNNSNQPEMQSSLVSNNKNLIRRYIIVGERRFSNYWWATVIFLGACGFLYTGISSYLGQNLFSYLFANNFDFSGANLSLQASLQDSLTSPGATNAASYATQAISGNGEAVIGNSFDIAFFPQGLLMSFYGSLGLLLSIYWILLIFWNVGGGFNEFCVARNTGDAAEKQKGRDGAQHRDKKEGFVRVFRWGYPGKNRKIDLIYSLKDVEAIRVELKQGLDPQRTIYLRLKSNSNNSQAKNLKREIPLTGISQPLTLKEIEKQASELANFLQVSLEGL